MTPKIWSKKTEFDFKMPLCCENSIVDQYLPVNTNFLAAGKQFRV